MKNKHLFAGDDDEDQIHKIFAILGTPTDDFNPEVRSWYRWKPTIPIYSRKGISGAVFNAKQIELLSAMLEYLPEKRINSREAYEKFSESFVEANMHFTGSGEAPPEKIDFEID